MINYTKFIEARLSIIDKSGVEGPYILNAIQARLARIDALRKIELKARQQGLSSYILGKKTGKFILEENKFIVTIADNSDNAAGLLERVKYFISSYERKVGVKVPLKYNSKYELHNEANNNKFIIGTAENTEVGRSRTITDLHLSEAAFYKDLRKLLASALQAVVPDGEVDIETTANGMNEFKEIWDGAVLGENGFAPLFFKASDFYTAEFLDKKRKELGRLFVQEYPETPEEAFLTSGDNFFDTESLSWYLRNAREVIREDVIYA